MMRQLFKTIISAILLCHCLMACASLSHPQNLHHPQDPFERLNRQIFRFNYTLDKAFLRPVANFYQTITPIPVQKGIHNVFANLDEIPSLANDILQLDPQHAVLNAWRFLINSTLGLLGMVDVATHFGLPAYKNDLGLTFAKWGVHRSPYLQIIFLGPSTLRDGLAIPGNYYLNPVSYIDKRWVRFTTLGVRTASRRAALLPTDKLVDTAFDPYIFVRDAYLQSRQADINRVLGQRDEFIDDGINDTLNEPL